MNVIIERIDKDLDGIGKIGESLIKVPYTNIGDVVNITATNNENNTIIATEYNFISKANHKAPICEYYTKCGGCKAQHMENDDYLHYKKQNIINNLQYQGLHNITDIEILHHTQDPLNKRKRVVFTVLNNKIVGFHLYKSNNVINIEQCPLLTHNINNALPYIRNIMNLGTVVSKIYITEINNSLDIVLELTKQPKLNELTLMASLSSVDFINQVFYKLKAQITPAFVKQSMYLNYNNHNVSFAPADFTQASDWAETIIQNLVIKHNVNAQHVLDLFSGYGGYAFNLLQYESVKSILCVDTNANAVNSINKLNTKVKAIIQDIFTSPVQQEQLKHFDSIIVNPPRLGAKKQVEEIANTIVNTKHSIKKITLVYCSSATFARDLKILMQTNKVTISSIIAIDQFIYSPHIELVAELNILN